MRLPLCNQVFGACMLSSGLIFLCPSIFVTDMERLSCVYVSKKSGFKSRVFKGVSGV